MMEGICRFYFFVIFPSIFFRLARNLFPIQVTESNVLLFLELKCFGDISVTIFKKRQEVMSHRRRGNILLIFSKSKPSFKLYQLLWVLNTIAYSVIM